jgi:hypothetical protein
VTTPSSSKPEKRRAIMAGLHFEDFRALNRKIVVIAKYRGMASLHRKPV